MTETKEKQTDACYDPRIVALVAAANFRVKWVPGRSGDPGIKVVLDESTHITFRMKGGVCFSWLHQRLPDNADEHFTKTMNETGKRAITSKLYDGPLIKPSDDLQYAYNGGGVTKMTRHRHKYARGNTILPPKEDTLRCITRVLLAPA